MVGSRAIDLQELSKHFGSPEKAVAKSLGICLTSLKKICRQHGVYRWPYRKIKSLDKKLQKLEVAMSTAKDDPSMVFARWGGEALHGSASGAPSGSQTPSCSANDSEESNASTPRLYASLAKFPAGPEEGRGRSPMSAIHVSEGCSSTSSTPPPRAPMVEPVVAKLEFGDKITRDVLAVTPPPPSHMPIAQPSLCQSEVVLVLEASPSATYIHDRTPSPEPEYSDADLIAMLAQVAGTASQQMPPVTTGAKCEEKEATSCRVQDERDADIMTALAECCAFGAVERHHNNDFSELDGCFSGQDDVFCADFDAHEMDM